MKNNTAYSILQLKNNIFFKIVILGFFLLVFFSSSKCIADDLDPEFDEILIYLNVPQIGGKEIPAVIRGTTAYLPVTDIFDFLKIKNTPYPGFDSITGFFILQQNSYVVDITQNIIRYQDRVYELSSDAMIRTGTNLYLKSSYFGDIFGLECTFNFRSLSVTVTTKLELPIIREMKQELMRQNADRLKGMVKADSNINRNYPFFHFGAADWSVLSSQQMQGITDTRCNLSLGGILAGGETKINLNYSNNITFKEKQQYYLWRYVNNDFTSLRQLMIGKIYSQAISSIYSPIVGLQITNTPSTYRQSFGSYVLSNYTQPDWIVELYVNDVLIDYVKADASGFFTFNVPLVYGNSLVRLRYYGKYGEVQSTEQNFSIPYNFIQLHKLEYTASTGIVEDSSFSKFSRASFNYGLKRFITIGSGVEYLSSIPSGKTTMPFINTSLRLTNNLLLFGDYTYGVRSRGILNYRLPSNLLFEFNYSKYDKEQKAITNNYLEERKFVVSMPIRSRKISFFSRLTINQVVLPSSKFTVSEMLLSGAIFGINTNFTTSGMFYDDANPYIYSSLSLSLRLKRGYFLTPQAQYEFKNNKFILAKCGLDKKFKHIIFNTSVERNFIFNINTIRVGLRYEFKFAQTGGQVEYNKNTTIFSQSASGSLILDAKTNYLGLNNRVSVGKGGVTILPYLDINCNGMRDFDEPKVNGLNIHINGGRIEKDELDTLIRIFDLEPYTNCFIEMDCYGFENIAWQLNKKTISVSINPNQYKLVEVPVSVVGEVSGMVYLNKKLGQQSLRNGQGLIKISIYRRDSTIVASTVTESDGFFSYLGLAPGYYFAKIDASQLNKLQMAASPIMLPFKIKRYIDGDVVDDLEFDLSYINAYTQGVKDTSKNVVSQNKIIFKVQFKSSYVKKSLDSPEFKGISDVKEYYTDGVYKYLTGNEKSVDSAKKLLEKIKGMGFKDAFIVAFLNGEKISMQDAIKLSKYNE